MKIGILTSSRADYSIYKPLLDLIIKQEKNWQLEIIAFGTHLSEKYGYTVEAIIKDGFKVAHKVDSLPYFDSPEAIAESIGRTIQLFSEVWKNNSYDLVFALGDRYEMFAAVTASLPFNIRIAHLHGGETTRGAIDNAFRHSISHMSKLHFVSSEEYKIRLREIVDDKEHIYNVGALSYDNLTNLQLYTTEEFQSRFHVDLARPTVLITIHPETVSFERNEEYTNILLDILSEIKGYQYLITMPNADTMGLSIRKKLIKYAEGHSEVILKENLGTVGYLSAMKSCSFMLGNTSSGFIEAAFFPKWVINLGDRQKGRILTPNIIHANFNRDEILSAFEKIKVSQLPLSSPIYGDGTAAQKILKIVKENS
jgi:GDP/UDP-N,N'-diacetylbacillosamine 2-epimerase (hydrolysing)